MAIRARTDSVEATRALAAAIADLVGPGDVLLLAGELGAGKTAFTQGFGVALGIDEQITSPTFTLPATFTAMNSGAYEASRTYARYQSRNSALIGKTKRRSLRRSCPNSGLAWACW